MRWSMRWSASGPMIQRALTCESCGQPFACEIGVTGCWCRQTTLTAEARAAVRERYRECLCPRCLNGYSVEPDPPVT